MKTIRNIVLAAVAVALVAACGEDFLEKSPSNFINSKDLKYTGDVNPAVWDGTLAGIYTLMVSVEAGGLSTRDNYHEDFGQKSFDIISDLLSSDLALVQGKYNRWVNTSNYQNTIDNTAAIPNYMGWRYYYKVIRAANSVIESLGGNDAVPEKDGSKATMGQAKALRAYAYFYLSQFYALQYNPDVEILPIYTSPTQPVTGKAKTSEVYELMVSDLTAAISLLENFNRGASKTYIDKNVAKGLLAYVYAAMGKNAEAKKMADEVIASGEFTLMNKDEVVGGFNTVETPGWMWGFNITESNALGLVSWWGMMGYYHYSYQAAGNFKGMDSGLYAQIKDSDIRKKQFGDYKGKYGEGGHFVPGTGALMPMNKFYNANKKPMGVRNVTDDYVFMRVTEMYLLSAEMAAAQGLDAEARTRLKEVLAQRFENVSDYDYVNDLSGAGLLNEIIFQTRIEFLGEGKSYLLMKRRKMTKTRGQNHLFFKGKSFNYNDPQLSFVIPDKEIQNNPYIEN